MKPFQLQLSPNNWSCLPTAFAIVLGKPVSEVIKAIGHDGSGVVFPTAPEPHCRRSFHIQELIRYCWLQGYWVTPFDCHPALGCRYSKEIIPINVNGLPTAVGVMCGRLHDGRFHAAAWNWSHFVDTLVREPNDLIPEIFYAVGTI